MFADHNVNGAIDAGDSGLPDQDVTLDQDNNLALALPTFTTRSNGVDLPIADNNKSASAIVIDGIDPRQLIARVSVTLSITHPIDDELDAFLISPEGTRVELFTDVGGSGDNFSGTTLDDSATTPITAGSAPFIGSFKPEGVLGTFVGQNANGTWRLELNDDTPGNTGTLTTWTLNVETGEPLVVTDAAGGYQFTGLLPGTYFPRVLLPLGPPNVFTTTQLTGNASTLASGQTLTGRDIGIASVASLSGATFEDLNGNGARDAGEPPVPGRELFLDLNNNGIPDVPSSAQFTTSDALTIPDLTTVAAGMNVSGLTGRILSMEVTVNFVHPHDSDLIVVLVSPGGRRVLLFDGVGGSGANFTDTTFNDRAATSITDGRAPFAGTFRPQEALSQLAGDDPNGLWRLQINDHTAGNAGKLTGWTLKFNIGEPARASDANGNYSFTGLRPGSYVLRQVVPAGLTATAPAGGSYPLTVPSGASLAGLDFGTYLPGDINGDDKVDFNDLLALAQNFGKQSGATLAEGDINGDGKVDFADLLILSQNFGKKATRPALAVALRSTGR